MENMKVIKVKPNENGELIIKLYGEKYKIELEEKEEKSIKKNIGKNKK